MAPPFPGAVHLGLEYCLTKRDTMISRAFYSMKWHFCVSTVRSHSLVQPFKDLFSSSSIFVHSWSVVVWWPGFRYVLNAEAVKLATCCSQRFHLVGNTNCWKKSGVLSILCKRNTTTIPMEPLPGVRLEIRTHNSPVPKESVFIAILYNNQYNSNSKASHLAPFHVSTEKWSSGAWCCLPVHSEYNSHSKLCPFFRRSKSTRWQELWIFSFVQNAFSSPILSQTSFQSCLGRFRQLWMCSSAC